MWEAKVALVAALAALGIIACQPSPGSGAPAPTGATSDAVQPAAAPLAGSGPDLADLEARELLPKAADDSCGARALANIINRPADMPGLPEASAKIRYLNPDSMATMDFSPDRLNVDVNAEGRIWRLRCG
jgi:hypothetical protein